MRRGRPRGQWALPQRGGLVVIDPDEEHWHGAVPRTVGEHLAINAGVETSSLEPSA